MAHIKKWSQRPGPQVARSILGHRTDFFSLNVTRPFKESFLKSSCFYAFVISKKLFKQKYFWMKNLPWNLFLFLLLPQKSFFSPFVLYLFKLFSFSMSSLSFSSRIQFFPILYFTTNIHSNSFLLSYSLSTHCIALFCMILPGT